MEDDGIEFIAGFACLLILDGTGGRYAMKEIKQKLSEIYSLLGISKTPKATNLGKYFKLTKTRVTLPDKTVKDGFKLEVL